MEFIDSLKCPCDNPQVVKINEEQCECLNCHYIYIRLDKSIPLDNAIAKVVDTYIKEQGG